MKRAAVYIRVSTQEQAQEGYSVGEQKERLIAYCKAQDWLIADIYVDGGYTGSNLKRPGIQKLMSETDKFDVSSSTNWTGSPAPSGTRSISSRRYSFRTKWTLFRCRRASTHHPHSARP